MIWLGLIVLAAALALAHVPSLIAARARLAEAERACEPTREVLGEIAGLEAELAAEERRLEKLMPFGPDGRPLSVLGGLVDATRASEGRLYVRSIQYANGAPRSPGAKMNESDRGTLVVGGIALDEEAVDRFVRDLLSSGCATHVELKSCARESTSFYAAPPGSVPGGAAASASISPTASAPHIDCMRFELQCRI